MEELIRMIEEMSEEEFKTFILLASELLNQASQPEDKGSPRNR